MVSSDQMDRNSRALFPRHLERVDVNSAEGVEDYSLFTMENFEGAVFTKINRRCQVLMMSWWKFIIQTDVPSTATLAVWGFNACLKEGTSQGLRGSH